MTIAIKIKCLPEPEVQFNNGRLDVDPRRALASSGPVDHRGQRTFRLGLIGLSADVAAARGWLKDMSLYRPAKEKNARRFRDWPGVEKALKVKFEVDEKFVRIIDGGKFDHYFSPPISGDDFDALVELFEGPISSMFGDVRPDCIVVCIPDELGDLRVENPGLSAKERRALQILKREEENAQFDLFAPTEEELAEAEALRTTAEDLLFRTFYRALKGTVHKYDNAVPIQILRRGTIERDEDAGHSQATRNWNFATALYYKSGGMPWRPSDLPEGVCFVGVSFHHLKRRGGHLVYASVAQAFSSDHEPFCLKGAHIDHEQRIDRQPYLNESQAFSLMRDILAGYEMRTGVQPKRVVVHKTSMYQGEEEKGFRDAAKGIVPGCDLVWLRQTPFRLVRKGSEEPWRGTLCCIEGESYLFTNQIVRGAGTFLGYMETYPATAKRDSSGKKVASPEVLQAWANEQLSILKNKGATVERLYWAASNLSNLELDPIDAIGFPIFLTITQFELMTFENIFALLQRTPIVCLKARRTEFAETNIQPIVIDNLPTLRPLSPGNLIRLAFEDGKPKYPSSLLGCLDRLVRQRERELTYEVKPLPMLRSVFGPMDALVIRLKDV